MHLRLGGGGVAGRRVELLGPKVRIIVDDVGVVIGAPRLVGLIAVLAVGRGRQAADTINHELWGNARLSTESGALKVLVARLNRLARAPGRDRFVVYEAGDYRFNDDVEVDTVLFRREAEWILGRDPTQGEIGRFVDRWSLDRWPGPTGLGAWADLPCVAGEIRELTSLSHEVTVRYIEICLHSSTQPNIVHLIRAHLDVEPYDERLWCLLVRAHYRLGHQAAALRAYEEARTLLAADLGVEPGPELRAVHDAVLHHDSSLRQERSSIAPGAIAPQLAQEALRPLHGREPDLDRLVALSTPTTSCPVVVVHGEAGIGKTLLLAHAAREHADQGHAVLYSAVDDEDLDPYASLQGWLDGLVPLIGRSRALQAVGELIAPLGTVDPVLFGPSQYRPSNSQRHQVLVADAVAALVETAARDRPMVLILDDVQWLTPTVQRVTRSLITRPWRGPVAVIAAARTTRSGGSVWLGPDHADLVTETMMLNGLDDHTAASFFDVSHDHVAEAVRDARGNPFVLGLLADEHQTSVHAAIESRLSRLPGWVIELAETIALGGNRMGLDELTSLHGLPPSEVILGMQALQRAGFATSWSSERRWSISHRLFRDAIVGQVPEGVRADKHRQIASLLMRRDEREVYRLAHHQLAAGAASPLRERLDAAMGSVGAALRSGAGDEAEKMLNEAIELLGEFDVRDRAEPGLRLDVDLQRAELAVLRGERSVAEAMLDDIVDRAMAIDELRVLVDAAIGPAALGAAGVLGSSSQHERLQRAHDHVGDRQAPRIVELRSRLVRMARRPGQHPRYDALVDELQSVARAGGDAAGLAHAIYAAHKVRYPFSRPLDELAPLREAETIAANRDPELWALSIQAQAVVQITAGRVDAGVDTAERARHVASRAQLPRRVWDQMTFRAALAVCEGDLGLARTETDRAFAFGAEFDISDASTTYAMQQFVIMWHDGRLASLGPAIDALAAPMDGVPALVAVRGLVAAASGDAAVATACLVECRAILESPAVDDQKLTLLCLASQLALDADLDVGVCRWLLEQLRPYSGTIETNLVLILGPVDRLIGGLMGRLGDVIGAREHVERTVAAMHSVGWPLHEAWALADLSGLIAEADPEGAANAADRACLMARERGLAFLERQANGRLPPCSNPVPLL